MYICAWLFAAGGPPVRHILVQPVQEKFPHPIKLERTGISAKRDYKNENGPGAWSTRPENYHTLEFTNLPSISPQPGFLGSCFLRLVYKHVKFGGFFFGFMVLLSLALLDRGKLSCTRQGQVNGKQAIQQFVGANAFE